MCVSSKNCSVSWTWLLLVQSTISFVPVSPSLYLTTSEPFTPPHLPDLLCLASARSSVWLQITHVEVVTFLGCHLMFMYKHNWWVAVALLAFPRESVTCPSQLFFEGWRREDQTLVCTKDFKPAGVTAQNNNNTLNSCKAFHPVIPKHFPLLNP